MSLPLVTIITPTYNRADLLIETIESVLGQDYENIEYIVLDDGSTDCTKDVIKPYLDRLQYSYHDNIGETATVNKGFLLSSGEIVCVINSDDPLYTKNAISIAVKHLNNAPDALMAYSDWVSIDADGRETHKQILPQYNIENMVESANVAIGPGMFIRKSTIERVGPRTASVRYVGDLDYSFRIASVGHILHIPQFLATHRLHQSSASSSAKGKDMADEVAMLGETYIHHFAFGNRSKWAQNRIMSRWYLAAMHYTGNDIKTALSYFCKAMKSSALMTIITSLQLLLGALLSCIFKKRYPLPP
jgi:glycosyltransferase involved in cell wall biosynthesis